MIEKFLEKFLPQITERLNENEEVGKALIEALAVLDNYATINNVQFTDEQVNTMLGIVPEPAPEPNADIPAEIVNIVEKKKRGRKPKTAATAEQTNWTWRFKTENEFIDQYGSNWREGYKNWDINNMDYLFGTAIPKNNYTIQGIDETLQKNITTLSQDWGIFLTNAQPIILFKDYITQDPLPTAAVTAPTTWNWRFKTEQELFDEFGIDWRIASKPFFSGGMEYLFGQPIAEIDAAKDFIKQNKAERVDTEDTFGIKSSKGQIDLWFINTNWLTQKPLPTTAAPATQTTWNWRFKTEKEMQSDFGAEWREEWGIEERDFLFGKAIPETTATTDFIMNNVVNSKSGEMVNTKELFGIDSGNANENEQYLDYMMITNKPLSTIAAPVKTPAKRGRKPKASSNWTWRFKTEKELREEYGGKPNGSIPVMGSFVPDMFYLFGKPIEENDVSKKFIEDLKNEPYTLGMDTKEIGISNGVKDTYFSISFDMITNKPLPTAATPAKTPKKRGRKPKSELPEIDLGGIEDIGDIDIDDIDFDNLVI